MDKNGQQWTTIRGATCISDAISFYQLEHIPPGVSKIKYVKNWASGVFDLSRSRNIGKYRKLAKYWQITPRAEQMAWTGGFLSFPQGSFHLATFSTKLFTEFHIKRKNGITDACSTADCCPLLTICPDVVSDMPHCSRCRYQRLPLDGAVIGTFE